MIVYVSIGNSDDSLTQEKWSEFTHRVEQDLSISAKNMHGRWFSQPNSPWQNACWCIELSDDEEIIDELQERLGILAGRYSQNSIAWAEAEITFIYAAKS